MTEEPAKPAKAEKPARARAAKPKAGAAKAAPAAKAAKASPGRAAKPAAGAAARAPEPVAHRGDVLSVASECAPLIKTGGLADVVGALPAAMAPLGWRLRTLIPAYRGLIDKLENPVEVWSSPDLYGGSGRVLAGTAGGMELLLLDAPHLFDRNGGPYHGQNRGPTGPTIRAALPRSAGWRRKSRWMGCRMAGSRDFCMRMTGRRALRRSGCMGRCRR